MRIVIDLLGAQTISAERGIGRYSLLITEGILRLNRQHEYWIALNSYFPDRIEHIKSKLAGLINDEHYLYYSVPVFEHGESLGENVLARYGEIIREKVIFSVQPDAVYLTSLFDGYGESFVSSINKTGYRCLNTCSLYDLIPLLNPDKYLADDNMNKWYRRKVEELKKADCLFSISDSARCEAISELAFAADDVINVGTGVNDFFHKIEYSDEEKRAFFAKYGIKKKFIMYSGAADPRKNLAALIEAFACLPEDVRVSYQLVFVSKIYDNEKVHLLSCAQRHNVSDDFIITGYVSDDDLRMAYNLCELFVFPSLHEGFGLPAAEASLCGSVVIGSDCTSIPEIICYPDSLFNPKDIASMVDTMLKALMNESFRAANRAVCFENCQRFRWNMVAEKLVDGLEQKFSEYRAEFRKRVAVITPAEFGVAATAFTERLVAKLAAECEVTIIKTKADEGEKPCFNLLNKADFENLIFVIDSSEDDCRRMLDLAGYYGGILAVNDAAVLSSMLLAADVSIDRLYLRYGYEAVIYADNHLADEVAAKYPLYEENCNFIDAVICSDSAWKTLSGIYPSEIVFAESAEWAVEIWRVCKRSIMMPSDIDDMVLMFGSPDEQNACLIADAVAKNMRPVGKKQLLVDVTILSQVDAKTGIQRVVKNNLAELFKFNSEYRIEPVWLAEGRLRYARRFSNEFLNLSVGVSLGEDIVDMYSGDVFLGLDLNLDRIPSQKGLFKLMRACGVSVQFVVYDLLPVQYPQFFRGIVAELYPLWLDSLAEVADRVICISRAVADEVDFYLQNNAPMRYSPLSVSYFYLGADIKHSASLGIPDDARELFAALDRRISFLMVSTLEPRKGYEIILSAFKKLWAENYDINLVLVGKPGWNVEELLKDIKSSPEYDSRLFWLNGVSDEYLDRIYAETDALIAASYGEGFGLPLIEAAQHQKHIIARDIPVFREVASDGAFYFSREDDVDDISRVIVEWIEAKKQGVLPKPQVKWLTWQESTQQLLAAVRGNSDYVVYRSDDC